MNPDSANTCQRAHGYLELGMPQDALEELDALPAEDADLSAPKMLRVDALVRLERWLEAADLCLPMLGREPQELFWWTQGAFAQRRARSIEEAEKILRASIVHHPPEGIVLYNLACYACVQGRMEEARDFLGRVILGDPETIIRMALADEDLLPLRSWVLARQAELRARALPGIPPEG